MKRPTIRRRKTTRVAKQSPAAQSAQPTSPVATQSTLDPAAINAKIISSTAADFLKDFSIADIERATAYSEDFKKGFHELHTFAQGVTIFGSARLPETDKYYIKARELGRLLANNGHTVITGGGPGIMEAANRGAYEYGGRSIGLNIVLSHEQHPNPYLTDTIEFEYFFARKVILTMASKAYAFFPGGYGTLDELTEVLVLMQEHKMPQMPVFLVGHSFWRPFERFLMRLSDQALIAPSDMNIYTITDDVEDIVTAANKVGHPKVGDNYYNAYTSDTGKPVI